MTTLVKLQKKGQMTLPSRLRAAIGVSEGDRLHASVQRGRIVLTPTLVIDRAKFPNADDEYTPSQRRYIDARLAKSEKEIKQGRTYGPFDTAEAMIRSMKEELKKRAAHKKTRRSR